MNKPVVQIYILLVSPRQALPSKDSICSDNKNMKFRSQNFTISFQGPSGTDHGWRLYHTHVPEYTKTVKAERRKKDAERGARMTVKGGNRPTEETRKTISNILKEKLANGEIKKRKVDPNKVRKGVMYSNETRAKISVTLRNRWANDDIYRNYMVKKTTTAKIMIDTRKRISETLKAKTPVIKNATKKALSSSVD